MAAKKAAQGGKGGKSGGGGARGRGGSGGMAMSSDGWSKVKRCAKYTCNKERESASLRFCWSSRFWSTND